MEYDWREWAQARLTNEQEISVSISIIMAKDVQKLMSAYGYLLLLKA